MWKPKGTLPPPSFDHVDTRQYYKALDYDHETGRGDFENIVKYKLDKAWDFKSIANQAEQDAQTVFPKEKGANDSRDAFRHALGSYKMTKKYGARVAKEILDGHERKPFSQSSPPDTAMSRLQDLYNNRVGMEAALDPANKDRGDIEVIMELYKARKLQVRPFNDEPFRVQFQFDPSKSPWVRGEK